MHPFGRTVRALRRDRGLRQAEIAARVYCSQQKISEIEAGRARPSLAFAQRLARALELVPEQAASFWEAFDHSQSVLKVPEGASEEVFYLVAELSRRLPFASPACIELLRQTLRLCTESAREAARDAPGETPRGRGRIDEEVAM